MKNEIVIFASILIALFCGVIILSTLILKSFPHARISGWIRRHIVTDEDLEP